MAQEMLQHKVIHETKEDTYMLGRLLIVTVGGLVAWKYRDSIREYVKGNVGAEKVDGALRSVQETSESLLDRVKEEISSRLGSARERVRAGAWEEVAPGRSTE